MEVHKVLHSSPKMGVKSKDVKVQPAAARDHTTIELTGMDGCPRAFRKACTADGETRLRTGRLLE